MSLDPEDVVVRYDEPSDTLFVHFYGTGVAGVSVQVDDYVFVRVSEPDERVIGLQIEAFFHAATVQRPELLALAQFANVRPDAVRQWLDRSDTKAARLGAIDAVIQEWSAEHTAEQ